MERVNILLVDDQPSKLLTYEAILRDLGENLIKATSASEALQHLLRHGADGAVLAERELAYSLAEMVMASPAYRPLRAH